MENQIKKKSKQVKNKTKINRIIVTISYRIEIPK